MTNFPHLRGTRFNGTGQVVSGSAVVTQAATTGRTYIVTDVSASSPNATCVIEVQDGSTVIWRAAIEAAGYIKKEFVSPLAGTSGNSLTIRAATAHAAYVNIGGFFV